MTLVANDELRLSHSRKGHEEFSSTDRWADEALCKGDPRFIQRGLPEEEIDELVAMCRACPVIDRCFQWANAQTQPVGFVVAGGRRWKAWNHCAICGKKVRGIDRCKDHEGVPEPVGTIGLDGTGREYKESDAH